MINIKNITIKNAGRFVGEHKVNLSSFSGLVQVNGKNLNTGGSSGSGKSTIFEAIMYALGVGSTPSTILQSRLTKDSLEVELVFEKEDGEYTVTRSKNGGLTFKTPTGTYSGSNKVAEEELQKSLAIPIDLVARVLHKKQKERGFFMSLTPKQTHSFLSNCLGLENWTKKQAKAQEDLKAVEARKASESASLLQKKSLFDYILQQPVPELPSEDPKPLERAILSLTSDISKLEISITELSASSNLRLSSISKPIPIFVESPKLIESLTEKIRVLNLEKTKISSDQQSKRIALLNNIKSLETAINKAKIDEASLEAVKKSLEILKPEIITLRKNICPTCTNPWEGGHQNSKLNSAIEEYKKLMTKEESLKASISSVESYPTVLEQEKNLLLETEDTSKQNDTLNTISSLENERNLSQATYLSQISESQEQNNKNNESYLLEKQSVEQKFREDSHPLAFDLENKKVFRSDLSYKSTSLKKSIEVATLAIEKHKTDLVSANKEVESLTAKLAVTELELEKIDIASKAIDSYINASFQDSLSQIATRANEILSRVPNTATTTISFDSYKETKSGNIKEEVSILVHMDDELKVPLKSLSGGEETAIELAVDLAVIEMIEERSGIGFSLYILDEPFDGLDAVCKANCLEILSSGGTRKNIFIVDHSDETKEMIPSKLTVVRDGQLSNIEASL